MSRKAKSKAKVSRLPLILAAALMCAVVIVGLAMRTGTSDPEVVSQIPIPVSSVQESLKPYRGKVVILNFWATWCGPCRVEIPDFVQLQQRYRSRGVEFIGVSLDPITPPRGSTEKVAPFMKDYNINYSIWLVNDGGALDGFDVNRGIPTTYVLDRNGNVVRAYVGVRPASVFERDIEQLL